MTTTPYPDFLVGRTQAVPVDGARSRQEDVLSAVPEETILGPPLILLYINDLTTHVRADTRYRVFADDCLQYRVLESISDQVQLQREFMNLGPSQYPKRRLSVRSRKVSKPRELYLELSDRSEI